MFHCGYQLMGIWTDELSLISQQCTILESRDNQLSSQNLHNVEHHIHNQKNSYQCLLGQGNVQGQNTG